MAEFIVEYPYILALFIFLARVADVSLGTFRTIVIFRGYKVMASLIGFVEIIIWLVAAGQVFKNLDQWHLAFAYSAGFATGIYVGMWIENRFAIGKELIRCISFNRDILADKIREEGFKVVSVDGDMGEEKPVEVLFIVERRRNIPKLIELINILDQNAVYTVSDLKSVYEGTNYSGERSFWNKRKSR
ncbi:MAG: DUF2179 domain-containing protein [Candidatus Marinarcus sp.]|uniref:DUF2179 domain-containing protein n=1 Tax=Candidatus Marinarcus sp. TaxID=3100987 RepID=UPI003B009F6C